MVNINVGGSIITGMKQKKSSIVPVPADIGWGWYTLDRSLVHHGPDI